jgi:hypothetical protein
LKTSTAVGAAGVVGAIGSSAVAQDGLMVVDDFDRPDGRYHGDGWETLNPGYWSLRDGALRRRLKNVGDKNPVTSFPWHFETHRNRPMPRERDHALPSGMIWRRDWKMSGSYSVSANFTVRAEAPRDADSMHSHHKPGYGVMGVAAGASTWYESREYGSKDGDASWFAAYKDDGTFGLYDHANRGHKNAGNAKPVDVGVLKAGTKASVTIAVDAGQKTVTAILNVNNQTHTSKATNVDTAKYTDGFVGLIGRGLLDFQVDLFGLRPGANRAIASPLNECHVCYPLGDTLKKVGNHYEVTFVGMFRNEGGEAEVRISDSSEPLGGWGMVKAAGKAQILSNDFRINTALIKARLPHHPGRKTMYYTVWRNGVDVTFDPRVDDPAGTAPGTGQVEPGPKTGRYVGRLPKLAAPYRVVGLGGHALHGSGPNLDLAATYQANWVHDQPTPRAYEHLEEFDVQIMAWDDDVWYMELLFAPPSTDDAYKVVTLSIAGVTTRWQMMRHWNTINPGDHDHGMDDVKGPEQHILRQRDDLGQDMHYMRRNTQINLHITEARENPSGIENPKRWRTWRMPNGDFSLLTVDSRLWRSSQDTSIWSHWGWDHDMEIYNREDPTRTLLGEEQFAWLQQAVRTDPSPLILLVGINCMHTVFTGQKTDAKTGLKFAQRDRVAADYAGWVSAGADRVIELLGSRPGLVTVYGDIHLASIVKNDANRFTECSFGPIGRSGSRGLLKGFGPKMKDADGRDVEVVALYHASFGSPKQEPREGPKHWNFLEMRFDPRGEDPTYEMRIRNIVDSPAEAPRGGGVSSERFSQTGRPISCRLPKVKTLPGAQVTLRRADDGSPLLGTVSLENGALNLKGLIDVEPGARVVLTAQSGSKADAQVIETLPL